MEEESVDDSLASAVDNMDITPSPALLHLTPSLPPASFSAQETAALDMEYIRYRFRHNHKINALCTTPYLRTSNVHTINNSCMIFVADVSNNITAYHLF